ncbi:uncharacterized protein B0T23DRAFT_132857 [Neurospora hispaniola]|uniref:Uncharacterized protein n=1 Tax=Neurospora hispaniola TaxID=588809 RepID=A0AAJ0MQW6_9PEZI|nr:hypothetical protein B0T23DRAFT_132857 [Neurospora hispaniola]
MQRPQKCNEAERTHRHFPVDPKFDICRRENKRRTNATRSSLMSVHDLWRRRAMLTEIATRSDEQRKSRRHMEQKVCRRRQGRRLATDWPTGANHIVRVHVPEYLGRHLNLAETPTSFHCLSAVLRNVIFVFFRTSRLAVSTPENPWLACDVRLPDPLHIGTLLLHARLRGILLPELKTSGSGHDSVRHWHDRRLSFLRRTIHSPKQEEVVSAAGR